MSDKDGQEIEIGSFAKEVDETRNNERGDDEIVKDQDQSITDDFTAAVGDNTNAGDDFAATVNKTDDLALEPVAGTYPSPGGALQQGVADRISQTHIEMLSELNYRIQNEIGNENQHHVNLTDTFERVR